VEIVGRIVQAEGSPASSDIAVITPHRAQRQLLSDALEDSVDVVDTVERLQGGERKAIIVSATASDPSAIAGYESFILDLNRSNVAFSRVEERLIVVVSSSLLDHIPAELENYDNAMLWKALRSTCDELVAEEQLEDGVTVQVLVPSRAAAAEIADEDAEPIVPGE
jgi:superfamily I DNA and/or RNA helicase